MRGEISETDYAAKLEFYEDLVATNPDVKRKGKTMPYTSLNGHMFSFLTKEGYVALRLPKDEQAAFVAEYNTEPVMQYGAVMKEYVAVPDDLLQDTAALKKYFDISYTYTGTLKPK